MSLLIETIKIVDGKLMYFEDHLARMVLAQIELFGSSKEIDFDMLHDALLQMSAYCKNDTYKCRILYGVNVESIDITVYELKSIESLQLVVDDTISYAYKSEDRSRINKLYAQRLAADDIIIIKNGLVTDSSYTNVACYDGDKWFTPQNPLLFGTQRQRLLDDTVIIEKIITAQAISSYQKIALFNAMIEFGEIIIDISNISSL